MKISQEILTRKGARKAQDIPAAVIKFLNAGLIETANLTEWLAADQLAILKTVLKEMGQPKWYKTFETAVNSQKKISANNNVKVIGQLFGENLKNKKDFLPLKTHTSDVVRSWGCWAIATQQKTTKQLLTAMKPFAGDTHFGVREVVIFATKDRLAADLDTAISVLATWTTSKDENVRRYAAETLRPTGVWTKKIPALHDQPKLGLPIIEPLKADPSLYVQNAVANWLNDASKSQPKWVIQLCKKWEKASDDKATQYIIKRGMRTINK